METKKDAQIVEIEQRLNKLHAEREALLKEAAGIDGAYLSTYEIRPAEDIFLPLVKISFKTNTLLSLS